VRENKKIQAINVYRKEVGVGLKEAKKIVEEMADEELLKVFEEKKPEERKRVSEMTFEEWKGDREKFLKRKKG